jgi:hypothetical protein
MRLYKNQLPRKLGFRERFFSAAPAPDYLSMRGVSTCLPSETEAEPTVRLAPVLTHNLAHC